MNDRNWMPLIIIVTLILVGLGVWVFASKDEVSILPGVATTTAQTYSSDTYGISFKYPETYELSERDTGTGERSFHYVTLARKTDLPPPLNGEGPPVIEMLIIQNEIEKLPLRQWITTTNQSNFKLSPDGKIASTTVDGTPALTFRFSGLYEATTTAFLHDDYIFALTLNYLTPEDEIVDTYYEVLDSVELK